MPFEFTATPAISPKCTSAGMVSGSGTDSKGSSGTAACWRADTGMSDTPTSAIARKRVLTMTSTKLTS